MKTYAAVVVALLSWGCGDGVGTDNCVGANVQCELPKSRPNVGADVELADVSMKDLPELAPTWTHELPSLPDPSDNAGPEVLLTGDLEGNVWLLTAQPPQLIVSQLDADGQIVSSKAIDPPRGRKVVALTVWSRRLSPQGPAAIVVWRTEDKDTIWEQGELIKFGASVDDRPQRILLDSEERIYTDFAWAKDGSIYGVRQGIVEKRDHDLELVWRQSALQTNFEDDQVTTHIGLLENERVAVLVAQPSYRWSGILDSRGNYAAEITALTLQGNDLFPQQGPRGPVLVAVDTSDDLVVATLTEKPLAYTGAKFLREDYASLGITNTVDPAGNVYLALITGGRARSEQRRAMCRVPVDGRPGCFMLPDTAELKVTDDNVYEQNLAANADGVVFLRVEHTLFRIDFPD